jgi:hypothetical protein
MKKCYNLSTHRSIILLLHEIHDNTFSWYSHMQVNANCTLFLDLTKVYIHSHSLMNFCVWLEITVPYDSCHYVLHTHMMSTNCLQSKSTCNFFLFKSITWAAFPFKPNVIILLTWKKPQLYVSNLEYSINGYSWIS